MSMDISLEYPLLKLLFLNLDSTESFFFQYTFTLTPDFYMNSCLGLHSERFKKKKKYVELEQNNGLGMPVFDCIYTFQSKYGSSSKLAQGPIISQ